jgi:hypothetical protein
MLKLTTIYNNVHNNEVNSFTSRTMIKKYVLFPSNNPAKQISSIKFNFQMNKPKKTIEFSNFLYFKFICCKGRLTKAEKEKYFYFKFLKKYMTERMDVIYYLKELEKNHRIRLLLLGKARSIALDNMKKPNLKNPRDMERLNYDLNVNSSNYDILISYYTSKLKEGSKDEFDLEIFNQLEPSLRKYILCRA